MAAHVRDSRSGVTALAYVMSSGSCVIVPAHKAQQLCYVLASEYAERSQLVCLYA